MPVWARPHLQMARAHRPRSINHAALPSRPTVRLLCWRTKKISVCAALQLRRVQSQRWLVRAWRRLWTARARWLRSIAPVVSAFRPTARLHLWRTQKTIVCAIFHSHRHVQSLRTVRRVACRLVNRVCRISTAQRLGCRLSAARATLAPIARVVPRALVVSLVRRARTAKT